MRLFPKHDWTDALQAKALTASPAVVEVARAGSAQWRPGLGGTNLDLQRIGSVFVQAQNASYGFMYQSQPAVRAVVDYIARNIAQLGLKLYERVSDDEREHAGDHPAARAMRYPNADTPGQQFIWDLVADFLVYDNAYALKFKAGDTLSLLKIPPSAVGIVGQGRFTVDAYRIWRADGTWFDVLPEHMLHWRGYDPENPLGGFSKLETLRSELTADATARATKTELDRAGLMPKGWIERPLEAPVWSAEAMTRFMEGWANQAKNQGRRTPVLEEGMEFKQGAVSPAEAQMLESRRFTKEEVASEYGLKNVPPANEEERRQVYADVLPPYCEILCAYLDLHILQREFGVDDYYFEFNLDEKQMSDDRLKALTSAAGGPVLTRNESRSKLNLPSIEGGDELITPLNVMVGKNPQPSFDVPQLQDPNGPERDGSHRENAVRILIEDRTGVKAELEGPGPTVLNPQWQGDLRRQHRYEAEAKELFDSYYERQARSLLSKAQSFDTDRWDRELADDLHALMASIVDREAGLYVVRLAGESFDPRQVQNYVRAASLGAAEAINRVTATDIEDMGVEKALARAAGERAEVAAASVGTRSAVFARVEAAKQAPGAEHRTKTWIANTARHGNLHGATVGLDSSWGGISPGSQANCRCSAAIN